MSNTGEPEEPELEKLREQLAAAQTEIKRLRGNSSKTSRRKLMKISLALALLIGIAAVLFLIVIKPTSNGDIPASDTAAEEASAEGTERPSVAVSCAIVTRRIPGDSGGTSRLGMVSQVAWATQNLGAENLGEMYISWNGEHEYVTNSFSLGRWRPGGAIWFEKTHMFEKPGKKTIEVAVMNDQGQRSTDSCIIWVP